MYVKPSPKVKTKLGKNNQTHFHSFYLIDNEAFKNLDFRTPQYFELFYGIRASL